MNSAIGGMGTALISAVGKIGERLGERLSHEMGTAARNFANEDLKNLSAMYDKNGTEMKRVLGEMMGDTRTNSQKVADNINNRITEMTRITTAGTVAMAHDARNRAKDIAVAAGSSMSAMAFAFGNYAQRLYAEYSSQSKGSSKTTTTTTTTTTTNTNTNYYYQQKEQGSNTGEKLLFWV
jgi:hypothetical protein